MKFMMTLYHAHMLTGVHKEATLVRGWASTFAATTHGIGELSDIYIVLAICKT